MYINDPGQQVFTPAPRSESHVALEGRKVPGRISNWVHGKPWIS